MAEQYKETPAFWGSFSPLLPIHNLPRATDKGWPRQVFYHLHNSAVKTDSSFGSSYKASVRVLANSFGKLLCWDRLKVIYFI